MFEMKKHLNYFLLLLVVVVDQLTKYLARLFLQVDNHIEIGAGHIKLQLTHNSGAFLSMGANWSESARWIVLIGFVILFLFFLWRLMTSSQSTYKQKLCYAIVLGGGTGNLIDRIFAGEVTDFLWLGYGKLQTGVFNIADMAILFGVLILFLEIHPKNNKKVI